jgi:hypothetical protein
MNIGGPVMAALHPIYWSVYPMSPMNIWGRSKSNQTTYIFIGPAPTNKYKVTFIGFKIDEYNLNIFVDTNEFKITDE